MNTDQKTKSKVNKNRTCTTCKDYTPQFNKDYDGYVMTCNWNKDKKKQCISNNRSLWRN